MAESRKSVPKPGKVDGQVIGDTIKVVWAYPTTKPGKKPATSVELVYGDPPLEPTIVDGPVMEYTTVHLAQGVTHPVTVTFRDEDGTKIVSDVKSFTIPVIEEPKTKRRSLIERIAILTLVSLVLAIIVIGVYKKWDKIKPYLSFGNDKSHVQSGNTASNDVEKPDATVVIDYEKIGNVVQERITPEITKVNTRIDGLPTTMKVDEKDEAVKTELRGEIKTVDTRVDALAKEVKTKASAATQPTTESWYEIVAEGKHWLAFTTSASNLPSPALLIEGKTEKKMSSTIQVIINIMADESTSNHGVKINVGENVAFNGHPMKFSHEVIGKSTLKFEGQPTVKALTKTRSEFQELYYVHTRKDGSTTPRQGPIKGTWFKVYTGTEPSHEQILKDFKQEAQKPAEPEKKEVPPASLDSTTHAVEKVNPMPATQPVGDIIVTKPGDIIYLRLKKKEEDGVYHDAIEVTDGMIVSTYKQGLRTVIINDTKHEETYVYDNVVMMVDPTPNRQKEIDDIIQRERTVTNQPPQGWRQSRRDR